MKLTSGPVNWQDSPHRGSFSKKQSCEQREAKQVWGPWSFFLRQACNLMHKDGYLLKGGDGAEDGWARDRH